MSKYREWYNSLPAHTKIYISNQPLWHDRDLAIIGAVGFTIGLMVGLILGV